LAGGSRLNVAMADALTTVSFRVKYWTEWGQNLVVVGGHPKLGEWDVRKGVWMHCEVRNARSSAPSRRPPRRQGGFPSRAITPNNPVSRPPRTQHVGEGELLWTAKASGAFNEPFEYRYAVVDGEMNVLRWDAFAHEAHFAPRDVSETNASPTDEERKRRDRVEIRDTWEFTAHPENIFRRKTFRDIVAPDDAAAVAPGTIGADALADRVERVLGAGSRAAAADDDRSAAAPVPAFRASACAAGDYVAGTTRVRLECRVLRPIPGMRLTATGSCASLGGWDRGKAAAMRFDEDSRMWRLDADVSSDEFPVRYKYALRAVTGANSALESGANRVIVPLGMPEDDCENDPDADETGDVAAASAAARAMAHQTEECHVVPGFPDPSVVAPMPRPGYGSGIVAEPPSSFGEQPGAARRSDDRSSSGAPASGTAPSSPPASEPSPSNAWRGPGARPSRIVARDGHFRFPAPWRGSGIAVPVFSLRSTRSVGAGDFGDLEALVELVERAGMNVVQILPVNDTTVHGTWWDSYPYSSVSVFALHPLYLRVQPLIEEAAAAAGPERAGVFDALRRETERARRALDLKEVDYEATVLVKLSIARRCLKEPNVREAFLESEAFRVFLDEQSSWLRPYAVFGALRELFGTAEHWRWGALSSEKAAETVRRLSSPDPSGASGASSIYDAVVLRYYVQFHLDAQLRSASASAASRGVVLKGDLPIGVDKASVDTWMHPELFRMRASTGAPPDAFDANGQNWGFPTYNWDVMSEDGYQWWRRRMTHLERYFSAMRVDHVLGFFRIWELPAHARLGRMGRFRPSVPIRRHELDERGLWFVDRLCDPYVTGAELRRVFGDRDGEAAGRFLEETGASVGGGPGGVASAGNAFRFKPEFATEEALLASDAFKIRDGSPDWLVEETRAMRAGLLALQHNVCLLRDPDDADAFYPRIEAERTSSFAALEPWARDALAWLMDDYFNRRQETLWREHARRVLPALTECTGQLVCGEDLGMVPPCVQPVLEDLGILGLRIQRMPHDASSGEFGKPETYAHGTVCSPSCHDTITTRAWYEADAARRRRFANEALEMSGGAFPPPPSYRAERVDSGSGSSAFAPPADGVHVSRQGDAEARRRTSLDGGGSAPGSRRGSLDVENQKRAGFAFGGDAEVQKREPPDAASEAPGEPPARCSPSVMRAIVRQHMASPSCLAVFPAQDLLALAEEYSATRPAEEETINDPTNNRHYWRFRLHVRLEDLASDSEWLAEIRQLVDESGRNPKSFFDRNV